MLRSHLRKVGAERGQALILMVLAFTVFAVGAAIAVDFGLWLSERRGAQKDGDLVSLSGAFELLDPDSTAGDVQAAVDLAAINNDIDPVNDVHNLQVRSLAFPAGYEDDAEYCATATDTGGRSNAVVLDVSHESVSMFAGIFGVGPPDIGAHACARAGSLHSTAGLRPWAVSRLNSDCFEDGAPLFGADCIFRLESPSSQVGSVRLGDDEGDPCNESGGGADKYRENIEEGADAVCRIGDLVDTEPGLNTGPTFDALDELLSTEGECDAINGDGDGIDQFQEAFEATSGTLEEPGPDVTFAPRDCETPRAISIVVLDEWFDGHGFDTREILGFAAFYLQQCEEVDGDGNVLRVFERCDVPGGARPDTQIRGFFMQILNLEGEIGDFDEFGTNVIRLAE